MKRSLIILALVLIAAMAVAIGLWWRGDRERRSFYTDGARITQRVDEAFVRKVLWQPPVDLGIGINSESDEYEPRISADGSVMVFVRGKAGANADLWFAQRDPSRPDGWSEPAPILDVNTDHDELGPALSPDGATLLFASDRPGGLGGSDLWLSRKGDFGWTQPVNLGPDINSEYNEYGASLSPDAMMLLFTSNRPASGESPTKQPGDWSATVRERYAASDYDLYGAKVKPDGYEAAVALDVLNTKYNEGAPAFSPAGDFLYFCSDRPGGRGGFDLYRSRSLEGAMLAPESLGDEINTNANEMDPAPESGGFAIVFGSDRARAADASAQRTPQRPQLPNYNLWRAESREVFVRVGPREPLDFAGLWGWISPLLLWLLLLLLGLALLLVSWKGVRSQRLGLLARCLLASLIAHLMIMILLTFWQVTTTIAQMVDRGSATRIVLSGSTSAGGGLAGQLRGGVSGDLNVAPRETAAAEKAEGIQHAPGAAAELVNLGMNRADAGAEDAARLQTASRESSDNRVDAPRTDAAALVVAQHSPSNEVVAPRDEQRATGSEAAASPAGGSAPAIARSGSTPAAVATDAGTAIVEVGAASAGDVEEVRIAAASSDARAATAADAARDLPQSREATQIDAMNPSSIAVAQPRDGEGARIASGEASGPGISEAAGGGASQRAATDVGADGAAGAPANAAVVALAPATRAGSGAEGDAPASIAVSVPGDSSAPDSRGANDRVAMAPSAVEIGEAVGGPVSPMALPVDGTAAGVGNVVESGPTITAADAGGGAAVRALAGGATSSAGDGAGLSVVVQTGAVAGAGAPEPIRVGDVSGVSDSDARGATASTVPNTPSSAVALAGDIAEGTGATTVTVALPTEGASGGARDGDAEAGGAVISAANASGTGSGRAEVSGSIASSDETAGSADALHAGVAVGSGGPEAMAVGDVAGASDAIGDAAVSNTAPASALALDDLIGGAPANDDGALAIPSEVAGTTSRGEGATTQPDIGGPSSALASSTGRRESGGESGEAALATGDGGMIAMAPGGASEIPAVERGATVGAGSTARDAASDAATSGAGAPSSDRALGLDDDIGTPALAAGELGLPGESAGNGVPGDDENELATRGPSLAAGPSSAGRSSGTAPSTFAGAPGAASIALDPDRIDGNGGGGEDRLDASTTSVTGSVADSDTISGSTAAPIAAALADVGLPESAPGMDISLRLPTEISAPANPYAARAEDTRLDTVKRMGGSEETEAAVALALEWLARHQSADGRWATRAFDEDCGGCEGEGKFDTDIATTGLALLCFLGSDHTHVKDGKYRANVVRGLQWLVEQQQPDGDLRGGETMYSHGIASIALAESLGMTKDARLQEPVRLAVDFIEKALNRKEGGWRYEPRQAGDTSVAGWQVMAMMSAKRAGLVTPDEAFAAASAWMDKVTTPNRPGRYAYQPGQPHSPSMTAEGLFIQQLLGVPRDDPRMKGSVEVIMENLPRWDDAASTYYWYYATLAMFQHQGPEWEKWNKELTRVLLANQRKSGAASGSWDPKDNWAQIGGRVYQTAICTLCLEVYYRYLPMYRSPQLASARSAVRGVVTDASTGRPIAGAMVKLDMSIGAGVLIAATDAEGRYALALPELPADFVAISASQEGYVPLTANISKNEAEQAGVTRDFALEPKRSSIIALEEEPEVHHLGNDEFEGAINSQFQKAAEGTSYRDQFILMRQHLPPNVKTAEVVLMVKGAQAQNSIFINDQRLRERMNRAPRDGSFGEFRVAIPLDWLREGANSIVIRSSSSEGDLDDFEFTNVQIHFDAEAPADAEEDADAGG